MTIKPDSWIKRMAREHQMIEPFVESQVRGSISWRLVLRLRHRVADEFKIFTSINNTVVIRRISIRGRSST
jgi:dCTP deaminase